VFDNLVVSRPIKQPLKQRLPSTFFSVALHGGLIWAGVVMTMNATEDARKAVVDTTLIFIQPDQPKEPPPPQLATLDPPPKGFQTLAAPIEIPTEIPPIDLKERFDPRDYSGVGQEGGVSNGVVGGTGPVDLNQVFNESLVDEIPEKLSGPYPVYPALLKEAGIQGNVVFEFVVDTTGHPEQNSFKVISTSHREFSVAAQAAVMRTVYRPGKMRGHPVRVLVRQPVSFTIGR
jgi:protein TonB